MSNRLHYSPQVQLDLDEIIAYYSDQAQDSDRGYRIVNSILVSIETISDRATRFPPVGPLPFTSDLYRFMVVGDYLVFFRVEGEDVYIDRVLNKRRNYSELLGLS